MDVPLAIAETKPLLLTVATAVFALPHAPSVKASVSVVVVPLHIIEVPPLIGVGWA